MIAAVMNFHDLKRSVIVVVIEADNLQRMKKGDPATLETHSLGGVLPDILYPTNYGVLVAYEEDEVELYKMARTGDGADLLRYLERGRKFLRHIDGTDKAFTIPGKVEDQ